jgi:hypothetical protein
MDEALESAAIQSLAGRFSIERWRRRPFRSPHHTSSGMALVGGGGVPRPGEISLAHHGVLFLDELPEFSRHVLEVLREPLESGHITISRAARQADFPASFQLIAAMNPCPCGWLGHPSGKCRCSQDAVLRYQDKISGPLLDRIDLQVPVSGDGAGIDGGPGRRRSERAIAERVARAHAIQLARQGKANQRLARARSTAIANSTPAAESCCASAMRHLHWSARAYHRVLKVARTIADLADAGSCRPGTWPRRSSTGAGWSRLRARRSSMACSRAARLIACGGWPKARRKARRMRSGSAKPVSRATTSIEWLLPSIMARAASTRSTSTARAGDCPVSTRKVRLNWRVLRLAAPASSSTDRAFSGGAWHSSAPAGCGRTSAPVPAGRELRLAAAAAVVDHQLARDMARHRDAVVALDQGQAQVDAGRHAGRGPDLALVDEDAVLFHAQLRIGALQLARLRPVGGGALAVQQAGFGQQEGAGADAGHAARLQGRLAQDIDEARRRRLARRQLARHQQRVDVVLVTASVSTPTPEELP